MSKIKIVCILVSIFILTTGATLFKKGLLTREQISYLIKKSSSNKSIKKEENLSEKEIVLALQKIEKEKKRQFEEKQEIEKFKERLSMQEEELKKKLNNKDI